MLLRNRRAYYAAKYLQMQIFSLQGFFNISVINRHGNWRSGNDFIILTIKRACFHVSGSLPKHKFLPLEKPLLQPPYHVAFMCTTKNMPHTEKLNVTMRNGNDKNDTGDCGKKELSLMPLSNDRCQDS